MNVDRYLEQKRREITFSQSALKIIAMFTMFIDHAALVLIICGKLYGYDYALYQNAISLPEARKWLFLAKALRIIGRLSFPLFAFLIVEGFRKTSNLFKYCLRIFLCAIISEIPYNLMVFNKVFCFDVQNILFTFFIGLLMLTLIRIVSRFSIFISPVLAIVAVLACYFLKTDYWLEGILLIYVFYIFRNDINLKCLIAAIILFVSSLEKYFGVAVISIFFIYFYDGTKGYLDLKRFPYLFYPLHMVFLYAIVFFSYLKK